MAIKYQPIVTVMTSVTLTAVTSKWSSCKHVSDCINCTGLQCATKKKKKKRQKKKRNKKKKKKSFTVSRKVHFCAQAVVILLFFSLSNFSHTCTQEKLTASIRKSVATQPYSCMRRFEVLPITVQLQRISIILSE